MRWLALLVSIVVAQLAGLLGAVATAGSVDTWYPTVTKPGFTPPDWVFGPAWTTLYLLMGIAAYLVWRRGWHKGAVKLALGTYAVQLLLNAAWSPVFFGLRWPNGGMVVIVLLWAAIVGTIVWFSRVSRAAAWLLAPYLAWVTYAGALNAGICYLN